LKEQKTQTTLSKKTLTMPTITNVSIER
jgi:hypothetical protein